MRNQRGITLVALIVTIIVLLILAGVSFALIVGEQGILQRVSKTKEKSELSIAQEQIELWLGEIVTEYYEEKEDGNENLGKLEDYRKKQLNGKLEIPENYFVSTNENGVVMLYQVEGNILLTR